MSLQNIIYSFLFNLLYRWVVESANARIKKWKYPNNLSSTNQVPFIGDYVRIVVQYQTSLYLFWPEPALMMNILR